MAFTVRALMREIVAKGLVSKQDLQQFWNGLSSDQRPATGEALQQELVAAGLITEYQADELLAGRGDDLLLANYLIVDDIGAGGMGQVFLARDRTNDREVALKTIRSDKLDSSMAVERFRREILAIAALEHPNIVIAFDVGKVRQTYFFTMEYVQGQNLATLVRLNGSVSVTQAVAYVSQAARGLGYAHEQGVIHRDVKPSNLILDNDGVVKVLDLGLALFVERVADEQITSFTNAIVGTADFISPEQAQDTHGADARSDIYSLGCTLYWLLTATPPYAGKTAMEKLFAHNSAEVPSLRVVRDDVPEALDRVFRKMLAKHPDERQQSMDEVIFDLAAATRESGHVPIQAPARSKDHPQPANSLKVSTETMTAPGMPSEKTTQPMSDEPTVAETDRPRPAEELPRSRRPMIVSLAMAAPIIAVIFYLWRWPMGSPDPSPPASSILSHRATLAPRTGTVSSMTFSPDGALLATAEGAALRFWTLNDVVAGPPVRGHAGRIFGMDFHPQGAAIATASEDGSVRIWDPRTGQQLAHQVTNHGPARCVAYAHQGQHLVIGCDDGTVLLWEAESLQEIHSFTRHNGPVLSVKFDTKDARLVSADDQDIHVWNVETREHLATLAGNGRGFRAMGFVQPNGPLAVGSTGQADSEIRIWDLQQASQPRSIHLQFAMHSLSVSPKGGTMAVAANEQGSGKVVLVDSDEGTTNELSLNSSRETYGVVYSPDATKLCVRLQSGEIQLWNLETRQRHVSLVQSCRITSGLAFSPDGQTLVSVGNAGNIKLWDMNRDRELHTLRKVHAQEVRTVAVSQDGHRMVTGSIDRKVVVWDFDTYGVVLDLSSNNGVQAPVYAAAFSPNGSLVAFGGGEWDAGYVSVWNLSKATIERKLTGMRNVVSTIAFSPDGQRIACGSEDGAVNLWNNDADSPVETFRDHEHAVKSVVFSPDGRLLASAGGDDQRVLVRDLNLGQTVELVGHQGTVRKVEFTDDGTRVISVGGMTIRVWDAANGQQLDVSPFGDSQNVCAAYSKQTKTLAAGRADGQISLWTIESDGRFRSAH